MKLVLCLLALMALAACHPPTEPDPPKPCASVHVPKDVAQHAKAVCDAF